MYLACPKCGSEVNVQHVWDFDEIHTCDRCNTRCRLQYTESRDDKDEYQCWWLENLEAPRRVAER